MEYFSTWLSYESEYIPRMASDFFTVSGKMEVRLIEEYRCYIRNVKIISLFEDLFVILNQYDRVFKYFNKELEGVDSDITRELNKVYIGISLKLMKQVGFCQQS